MTRFLYTFMLIIVQTFLVRAANGPGDSGVNVATEVRNGSVQQRFETNGAKNDFPSPPRVLETERARPIPNTMRVHSQVRWVGSDLAAIGQDVATNPEGTNAFVGWNLNNMRASFHDNLSNVPLWEHYSDPNGYRNFVALSADASIVANSSYRNLYMFDPASGAITFDFVPEDNRTAGPVAVARDGSIIVCAAVSPLFGGTHRVYGFVPPSTVPVWTFDFSDGQSTGVYGVNISADGSTVAVNGKFYGWILNASDGTVRAEMEIGNTESKLALSGDASVLAIAENNGFVKTYLWDDQEAAYGLLWQYRIPPGAFTNWASSVELSADGLTLIAGSLIFLSGGYDGSVYLFDTFGDGLPLWVHTGAGDMVDEVALSDDGSVAAAVTWGDLNNLQPDILIFERASNTPVFSINTSGSMFSLAMSSDGSTVVAAGKAVHARFFGNGGLVYNIGVDLGGGAVSGTVTLDGAPDNQGALVEVLGTTRSAITSASGLYAVANIPPGTYSVRISRLGYVGTTLAGITVAEGDTTRNVDVTLSATSGPPSNLVASHGLDSRIDLTWTPPGMVSLRLSDRLLAADASQAEEPQSRSARSGASTRVTGSSPLPLADTPDSIRIYRSIRSGGPYYLKGTVEGTLTTFSDGEVFPLRDYYYVITALYGDGESVYSNEAYGTVDSSFLQFAITTPPLVVTPVIDGVISPGEWTDALQVDISDVFGYGGGVPLPSGSVFMYFKYDSVAGTLYLAGEDFLNTDGLTDAEGFGLYFDDNNDNQFEPVGTDPLLREGNYWAYWYSGGPLVRFREIYTGGGTNPMIDTVWDASVAASASTGHFVGEVSIPISFFNKNHLQVYNPGKTVGAGLFMINRLAGSPVFHGWWPQTMNSVFTPSGFGNITIPITLLAPPSAPSNIGVTREGSALRVTWDDPTTGIDGDPLTIPVTLQLNRNGVDVGEIPTGVGTYLDTVVAPLGWYEYKLRGFVDVSSSTEYYGPYSETVGAFATADPQLTELRYDDGIPEAFYVVDFVYDDNKFGIRFTPQEYPATVYRVESFTNNGNAPILVSIYDDNGGIPGAMLTSEYPGVTHQVAGIDSFTVTIPGTDPPTITEGDFWVVLSYLPTSPGAPGIGADSPASELRSYFYTSSNGWVQLAAADLMVRASVTGSTVSIGEAAMLPETFALYQNYPNPFNPETRVRFDIPERSHVRLVLYDLLGREVVVLVNEEKEAGRYDARIDATRLASGVYFYRLQADRFTDSRRMVVVK